MALRVLAAEYIIWFIIEGEGEEAEEAGDIRRRRRVGGYVGRGGGSHGRG